MEKHSIPESLVNEAISSINKEEGKLSTQARKMVLELLDKAIARYPKEDYVNKGINIFGEYDIECNLLCPTCGAVVGECLEEDDLFYNLCPECGQKLKLKEVQSDN